MSLTHFFKSIYFPYSCKVPQTLELFCVVLTGEGRRWSEDCLMLYLACHCTRNIISISTCTDPDRLLKYLCGAFSYTIKTSPVSIILVDLFLYFCDF